MDDDVPREEYIQKINCALNECNDVETLDFVLQLLRKCNDIFVQNVNGIPA